MFVKPADRQVEGRPLVVRDPDLRDFLPAEGREVPDSIYWQRRLIEGDVVKCEPPAVVGGFDVQAGFHASDPAPDA